MGTLADNYQLKAGTLLERERDKRAHSLEAFFRAWDHMLDTKSCPECGAVLFTAGRDYSHATYCSGAFKQRAYRRRRYGIR